MDIQFATGKASQIYNRVLGNTQPEGKEDVQSLFSLAATEDGKDTLSEEEARDLEEALNRYDRSLRLGIRYYEKNEIDNALAEYRAWEECRSSFFGASDEAAINSFNAFIQNYSGSKFAAEAYYRLGFLYSNRMSDFDNGAAVYEKLISLYPQSVEASRAMEDLVWLYDAMGKEYLSFSTERAWLVREPYTPNFFYSPAPIYEEGRSEMLFRVADYLLEHGEVEEAKDILDDLSFAESGHSAGIANGALANFEQVCNEDLNTYLLDKAYGLRLRGEYFLHQKHDFAEARRIYQDLLGLARTVGNENLVREANAALIDIDIRGIIISTDAVEAVSDLGQTGVVGSFLEYCGLLFDYPKQDTVKGIPAETYLLGILLKSCWDVEEVRLVSLSKVERIDSETKTPVNNYILIYKNGNGWNIFDPNNSLDFCFATHNLESYEELWFRLEIQTGYEIHSVIWETPDHLFANSLLEFHDGSRLSPYDLVIALEQEKQSGSTRKMVQDIKTQINGAEEKHQWLISFARAYSLLPKYHFDQLRVVNFDHISDESLEGDYSPLTKEINLKSSTSSTAIHELSHHWDMTLARGQDGNDQTFGDPSLIYYKISWDAWSDYPRGGEFARLCNGQHDYNACALAFGPGQGWQRKPEAELTDFSSGYGLADGFEDLATSAESYVEGHGNLTRSKARQEMEKGNFEPAAKYLFNKYIRSFDPEDGLCFEYNVTPLDPPLTLTEVKANIESWLASHPNSIPQSTLTAIGEIEKEYLKLRARFNQP